MHLAGQGPDRVEIGRVEIGRVEPAHFKAGARVVARPRPLLAPVTTGHHHAG